MTLRRLLWALAACLFVVLPLGGGAMGATSSGANGDIVFVNGGAIKLISGQTLIAGATDPSWSPDGTKLAFVQTSSGSIKTCPDLSNCSGSLSLPLDTGSQPAWSPDGNTIAYVKANQIWTVPAGGGVPTPLTTAGTNNHPSWSPTSTGRIVFERGGAIDTCLVSGCEGSISTVVGSGAQPAWSPDGLSIAYQAVSSGHTHIFVVPAGGGPVDPVTTGTSSDESSPTWSPDSNKIAYVTTGVGIDASARSGSAWSTDGNRHTGTDATPDWQTVKPVNISLPTITGGFSPQTGQQLSATNGSWSGATKPFTYQWKRCDSGGNNCSAIGSATASTYAVVSADVGNTLRVDVTASNAAPGSTTATSTQTGVVTQAGTVNPPKNTAYPAITFGFNQTAPLVGGTITATNGTWTGSFPMTFTYQWKFCDSPAGSCYSIPGAKSSFYTVAEAYYGKPLRVEVTATNSAGSVTQNSEVTPAVTAVAPVLRVTPQILTARPVVDTPLTLTTGTWDGTPFPKFTYSWRRCNAPGDIPSCVPIAGATASTYTPKVADVGQTIRVWITGTNPAGSDVGITNHTFPVVDKQHFAPSTVSAPTVTGAVGIGRQLTASSGSFNGDAPIASTLIWQRCDATGAGCKDVAGATKIVYHPTLADVGYTLRVAVTVTNAYGKLVASSDATEPIVSSPPRRKGKRIVGTPRADYLAGGGFDDTILGLGGNDTLLGGAGDDRIDGGAGNDVITGGAGADTLIGGAGSDTIYAADGERDVIDCGDGRDRVVADSVDKVNKNCEVVQIGTTPSTTTPPPSDTTPTPFRRRR